MTEGPANPYMPPASADAAMPPVADAYRDIRAELRGDTRGRRVAGAFFLANAVLGVLWAFAPGTTWCCS